MSDEPKGISLGWFLLSGIAIGTLMTIQFTLREILVTIKHLNEILALLVKP